MSLLLKPIGFFKRWELVGTPAPESSLYVSVYGIPTVMVPRPFDDDSEIGSQRGILRKQSAYVRDFSGKAATFPLQMKGLRIEACQGSTFHLVGGCVASVELHRCKRVTLRIDAPIAALRVDDCEDVTVELSFQARHGFGGDEGTDLVAGGFNLYTTGSHSVRVNYPVSSEVDAPCVERLVAETLHTRVGPESHEPRTTVVDASTPWGNAPPGRPRQQQAQQPPAAAAAAPAPAPASAGGELEVEMIEIAAETAAIVIDGAHAAGDEPS